MRRFNIAVFMGLSHVDPLAFQAVVFQQRVVPWLELAIARQVVDCGGQTVAPDPQGNSPRRVQRILKTK